ncbi:LRRNT 2 domain-containing protein [Abeliophyllum distichum]|uniref:LRRNT 2 domain-containing protein n=1 Tax=Abeliophyllum distichum TaxID=126358 RepID=A0ABD1V8A0_9LAMI
MDSFPNMAAGPTSHCSLLNVFKLPFSFLTTLSFLSLMSPTATAADAVRPPLLRWHLMPLTTIIFFLLVSQICAVSAAENVKDLKKLSFENPSLSRAYTALQAWKQAIFSDPFNFKMGEMKTTT